MTATPLREDFPIYDLPSEKVIDGPWPPAATPAAVLANPDALQAPQKKKPGPKPGSKNKKRKTRKAKSGGAAANPAPSASVPATVPESPVAGIANLRRIAAGGEGAIARLRKLPIDPWLILAAIAIVCLGLAVVGASRAWTGAW